MVFNWFERQASSSGEPPATSDSPAVEQQPPEDAAQLNPEPDPSALQAADDQNGEDQDDVVQEEIEDEALVWAREAYARLKAQQQASATEPTTPVSTSPEPEPEPTPEPTSAREPESATEANAPVPLTPEVSPEPTPQPTPAPTVGGSLLEQAAAQRQQRQQDQEVRALEVAPGRDA